MKKVLTTVVIATALVAPSAAYAAEGAPVTPVTAPMSDAKALSATKVKVVKISATKKKAVAKKVAAKKAPVKKTSVKKAVAKKRLRRLK